MITGQVIINNIHKAIKTEINRHEQDDKKTFNFIIHFNINYLLNYVFYTLSFENRHHCPFITLNI